MSARLPHPPPCPCSLAQLERETRGAGEGGLGRGWEGTDRGWCMIGHDQGIGARPHGLFKGYVNELLASFNDPGSLKLLLLSLAWR